MNKLETLPLALALLLSATTLPAQTLLRIKVVNEAEQPLAGISFRIAFVGDYRSDPNGERSLTLPRDLRPGQPLAFELKNDTLAIWSPPAGKDKVPDHDPIVLKLLPKGDHRLLNRDEMKATMNKLISEATKKVLAEKTRLEKELASVPEDPLAEDAKRLGFSKEELLTAIEKVKVQLQESENLYDIGLAALYDKQYGKATKLIETAIIAAEKKIREGKLEEESLPEKYLNLGNARAGEHKHNEAVLAYEKAIALKPDDAKGYLSLSKVLYVMGDTEGLMANSKKAMKAYRRANRGKATDDEAYALAGIGVAFHTLGQQDSSKVYSQAALKIAREIGDRKIEANQLGNLGALFIALSQMDSSQVYLQAALKITREIRNREDEATQLGNLGALFVTWSQPDSSRVYLQAALKIAREISDRRGEATHIGNLGGVFSALGQPDSSRVYLQAALKITREIGYRQGEADHLGNLGLTFSDLGQPDSSWVYLQAALKIAREIGDRRGEATNIGNLGGVFIARGQPDSARVYAQVALKITREIGYRQGEAIHLGNLGRVFGYLNQPDSSRVYHEAAFKIAREIGYRKGEATHLRNLGLVYRDLGQPDGARAYYQAAMKIAREIGDRQGEAQSLIGLGSVYGDLSKIDSAFICYQAALKLHREIGFRQGEAEASFAQARIFRTLRQPDSAYVYYQVALKISNQIGNQNNEAVILSELGSTFIAQGLPDSARVCLLKSYAILNELREPSAIQVINLSHHISKQANQRFIRIGESFESKKQLDSAYVFYNRALQDSKEFSYQTGQLAAWGNLSSLVHESLHHFPEAFAIDQQRLQLDSTNLSFQADFAEKHFTTGRFAACEQRLAALLANAEVEPRVKIALRAIGIANALAQNKTQQVPAALETLQVAIAAQPDTFKVGWSFEGTKHFISTNETLAPHRAWLLQCFAAIERKEGREAILAGLKEVREKFKTVGK